MTGKRQREYERRRYEKYQAKQAERARTGARRRVVGGVVGAVAAVALVLGLVGVSVVGGRGDGEATESGRDAEPQTDAQADAEAQAPQPAPVDPELCPEPGPGPREGGPSLTEVPEPLPGAVTVTFTTTCGDVVAELDGDAAPQAVGSLVSLAREDYFDATPCHRLTTEGIFVLQCGDPTGTGTGGPGYSFGPVENAPADDVYPAGTLAMARRGGDGQSMGSQFFVVYADSAIPRDAAGGYTVMGQVTAGLDVVELVASAGLAPDGVAPAQSIGITDVTVEEAT